MLQGLHHIVLFCRDTARALEWYRKLGFAELRGYQGMYWVGLGDVELMLHPADTASGGPTSCVHHVSVSDVRTLFASVRELGLEPYDHQQPGVRIDAPVTRPWGAVEFELDDPDGHRWAFQQA